MSSPGPFNAAPASPWGMVARAQRGLRQSRNTLTDIAVLVAAIAAFWILLMLGWGLIGTSVS